MFYLKLKLSLLLLVDVVMFGYVVDFFVMVIMLVGVVLLCSVLFSWCRNVIDLRFLWLLYMFGIYLFFLCE